MCDLIECWDCRHHKPLEKILCNKIKTLWVSLEDVPMDPKTEKVEDDWHIFKAGTHREEIWHWFEKTFNISIRDLLYA